MKLVSSSLLQDLLDTVDRVSRLESETTMTTDFSSATVSGSYPAAMMGIMTSGGLLKCLLHALINRCVAQMLLSWATGAVCLFSGRCSLLSF